MGAALSLFVLLSLSVLMVRIAAVALRHTGLEEGTAKFQALSAISGTGFTTKEAETIVNYPVRRRIISLLMVIGNLGVVTVLATVVVSFVHTDGEVDAVVTQLLWLLGMLAIAWFLILSKRAERFMCHWIGRVLESTTFLGTRHFVRLLQVSDGYSVCEHPVADHWRSVDSAIDGYALEKLGLRLIAVHSTDGDRVERFSSTSELNEGDALILYGSDDGHEALEEKASQSIDGMS